MLQSMRSAAKWIWWFVFIAFVGGFLLLDSSGLLGGDAITTNTTVGSVNGRDILYTQWINAYENQAQQAQQAGRTLTLDDQRQLEDQAFNEIVAQMLLEEEYKRRGIRVTNEEIIQAAEYAPPPWIMQAPDLQTEGRFDIEKYRRMRASPAARQQGLNVALESFYRSEIPRQKLLTQIAGAVYVTNAQLWRQYQDIHDSARVAFVALRPDTIPDSAAAVSDAEIRAYYDAHREDLRRPGRAVVSVLSIERELSAADSAVARARAEALRAEVVRGASFEEVARRESADSSSAVDGGLLPPLVRGRYVPEFERAAYALRPGEISQPVATQFGYHIIKLDSRTGDSLTVRHIMVRLEQSDSSAAATDRLADSLDRLAAGTEDRARFDSAARVLGLEVRQGVVVDGNPLVVNGVTIPSAGAWAFRGASPGETSELFTSDEGYYLARLDSLQAGGIPELATVRAEIRSFLALDKKLDALMPAAQELAREASATSLEAAAAKRGLTVQRSPMFNRLTFVPGLGRLNQAIGAAFTLPVNAVGAPVKADDAVIVMRVEERQNASTAAFEQEKDALRAQMLDQARQRRAQEYVEMLRRAADVEDRRAEVTAAASRQQAAAQP